MCVCAPACVYINLPVFSAFAAAGSAWDHRRSEGWQGKRKTGDHRLVKHYLLRVYYIVSKINVTKLLYYVCSPIIIDMVFISRYNFI